MKKQKGKQVRKPVADNFAPKRLALNFQPPMVIMEYLVINTGKLYHHKMRLDSILRKPKVTRQDVLNYIKNKHCLYFTSGKIKDDQLYKFIDKIMIKKGLLSKSQITKNINLQPAVQAEPARQNEDDDFDYLNDDEQYEEDYEDYEDPSNHKYEQQAELKEKQSMKTNLQKNAFLTYCQQYEAEEDEGEAQASWDLDLDQDADFV